MDELDLIGQFRDKVNQHDFVFFKYHDVRGKNKWNCICSAMDWITVGMEYICDVKNGKRSCIQSMEMFAYIASIDVVWEAIQQIHRVLFNTDKIPFKNEKVCFEEKIIEEDDNAYFKTLRASFGAHPVNLKRKETSERYFASWSGDFFGHYTVTLYSNVVENKHKTMFLKVEELNRFLDQRYHYLNRLMDEIDKQYEEFKEKMKNIPIKQVDGICEQLEMLREASSERLNLHNLLVNDLIMIFNVPITNKENKKMVDEYKEALKPVIIQVYDSLQSVNYQDKVVNSDMVYQTTNKLPNGYDYFIGKIFDYVHGMKNSPSLWEPCLQKIFQEQFVLEYSSYEELYILIISCINKLNRS